MSTPRERPLASPRRRLLTVTANDGWAPTASCASPTPTGRDREPASSRCWRPPSAGAGARTSGRTCRAPSPSRAGATGEAHFLLEDVGPGTRRLCELRAGDGLWALGPLGPRLHRRRGTAGARCWSAAAWGSPRWRSCRTSSTGADAASTCCSAFATAPAPRAPRCCATRASPPTTARSATTVSSPSCSRAELERDAHAVVYACGPPPMLEAVRALCAAREVPAQLALEAGMACGFGACYGCVVPKRGGGYLRVCVDGPVIDAAELESCRRRTREPRHERRVLRADARPPDHQRLGHVRRDRRAARRSARRCDGVPVRGVRVQDDHAARPAPATRRRGCGRPRRG